ncbi:MAG: S8 family serine peptidase [Bacteroidia bacterium]|nr:S8 family serine peptidase [Bacteroidia bacterium]MDW8301454.1 S8 family serine peptidase [Bacteroidia bacterium]
MKTCKVLVCLFFICLSVAHWAKPTVQKYWIFFKDKPHTVEKVNSDLWLDADIFNGYKREIEKWSKIENESKWLNAVTVYLAPGEVELIKKLYFVQSVHPVATITQTEYKNYQKKSKPVIKNNLPKKYIEEQEKDAKKLTPKDYGITYTQNALTKITELHKLGYTGKGIRICVMDGGFPHVDENPYFERLRKKKRIIKTYDFVEKEENVYNETNEHGSEVLSTIAGYIEGSFIGGAFDAEFLLARTEDARSETRAEEDNWVAGAEWAYKNGARIISSSLGYTRFDDKTGYEYKDLNGKVSPVSRAATLAARRGIIVLISAGNEGDNGWHYISTPADADSVISVGAVDPDNWRTSFSSYGPTADKRIKPDVMSMGGNVAVAKGKKGEDYVDGTSFACPLTTAVVACLLQSKPNATWKEIYIALTSTADQAFSPDSSHGYGVINAYRAYHALHKLELKNPDTLNVVKNPIYIKPVYKKSIKGFEIMLCFYLPENAPLDKIRISMEDSLGNLISDNILSGEDRLRLGRNMFPISKAALIRLSKIVNQKENNEAILRLWIDGKEFGNYRFKDK